MDLSGLSGSYVSCLGRCDAPKNVSTFLQTFLSRCELLGKVFLGRSASHDDVMTQVDH